MRDSNCDSETTSWYCCLDKGPYARETEKKRERRMSITFLRIRSKSYAYQYHKKPLKISFEHQRFR